MGGPAITAFGITALTFMMMMYALERRHQMFVLAFAIGCLLSSSYGFLSGAWPFGAVELVWSAVALRRYLLARRPGASSTLARLPEDPAGQGSRKL